MVALLWLERFVANRKINPRADLFCKCYCARPFQSETQLRKHARSDMFASSDSHDILRRVLLYVDHLCLRIVTSVGSINANDIVEFGLNLAELFASDPLNVPTSLCVDGLAQRYSIVRSQHVEDSLVQV